MDCDSQKLSLYVDRELAPGLAEAVARHLTTCSTCSDEVADLRALAAAVVVADPPAPRESAIDAAVRAARLAVARPAPTRRPRASLGGTLARFFTARVSIPAPALALAAILIAMYWASPGDPVRPGLVRITVHPPARQRFHEDWPDRTALWEAPEAIPAAHHHPPTWRVVYDESVQL